MKTLQERSDVLVLGATGFTGRLITKYLTSHRQTPLFSLALGARSSSKLQKLVADLNVAENVRLVEVDVNDVASVERAVKNTRVVINTVGPYWTWGTPVVAACVRNGIHYVDLTGETDWIRKIIVEYDYAATKTGAIIVPACGYDSVPSDITVWLANRTMKAYATANRPDNPYIGIRSSISAQKHKGGISGGSFSTMMTMIEDIPLSHRRETRRPYSLSPVSGGKQPPIRFIYELVVPGVRTIVGGLWVMAYSNTWVVQRTFGLLEARALEVGPCELSTEEGENEARQARYGPEFFYDEFLEAPSKFSAFITSATIFIGFMMLRFFSPVRALAKKYLAQPGSGPSEEAMAKGYFEISNVSTSASYPPIEVQTFVTGKGGDPGYILTAIMISESALSLLLPPQSTPTSVATLSAPDVRRLTPFARKGGVLTPMTAFGEELVTRLSETRRFTFKSYVVEENAARSSAREDSQHQEECRKDI